MKFHEEWYVAENCRCYVLLRPQVLMASASSLVTRSSNISWTRASPSSLRHMIHSGRRVSNSTEEMITILKVIKYLPRISPTFPTHKILFIFPFFWLRSKRAPCYVACTYTAKFAISLTAPAWFTTEVSSLLPNTNSLRSFKIERDEPVPRDQIMGNL